VFESLFERSADAIWLYDVSDPGRAVLVDCNQAAVELIGAPSKDQLLSSRPEELSPLVQPDGTPSDKKAAEIIAIVRREKTHRFEWALRRLDGKIIPSEVSVTAVVMRGKHIHVAVSRDISQRKRAESALRESEAKFRALFEQRTRAEESLNDRVRISTLNADIAVALNAAGGPQAMLQHCAELLVRHMDVAFARIWTLNETTDTLELEASAGCYTHMDGAHSRIKVGEYKIGVIAQEKRPLATNHVQSDPRVSDKTWATREGMVSFAGYPLLIEDRVLGVLAMFARRPLTEDTLKTLGSVVDSLALGIERKRAQTALAESEARFSAAFQASPVFISIFRVKDEKYVLANDALVNWLGYDCSEVLGRTSGELGMWDDPADRELIWRELRSVGSIRQRECRWRNRAGKLFTILLSAETISIAKEPHILSMALDITNRKQAEIEMLKALAREKELSQLKSNFVSMVSHEFRTPLGIIQSSAELLHDFFQEMPFEERDAQLESITRNTRRMAGMMEEILVLSRLEAGKLDFRPSRLDLAAVCRRIADEVLSATNRRCPIGLHLPADIGQAQADEGLLGHIFTNLLTNAVKYSEPDSVVRLEVQQHGVNAHFIISDQGIGIPEEDQPRLFTAFHRGANVGNRSGTGLGLLLVRRCVQLHRGHLQIQSELGKGTVVTVTLPVFPEFGRSKPVKKA
jgi:PAS domain S-box-containing protein